MWIRDKTRYEWILDRMDPAYRYKWSILDVCQDLHGEVTGSSEGCMSPDEQKTAIEWLRWRLDNWQEPTSHFDRNVQSLIYATIAEWENKQTPDEDHVK